MDDAKNNVESFTNYSVIFIILTIVLIITSICIYLQRNDTYGCICVKHTVFSIFVSIILSSICAIIAYALLFAYKYHNMNNFDSFIYRMHLTLYYHSTGFRVAFSLAMLLLAVHRYFAVTNPLRYRDMWVIKNTKFILYIMWFTSTIIFAVQSIILWKTRFTTSQHVFKHIMCICFSFNLVTCAVITYLYLQVIRTIRKRNIRLKTCCQLKQGVNYRTIIMCIAMSALFVLTYLPLSIHFLFHGRRENYIWMYIYLLGFVNEPVVYIIKRVYEKRCCVEDADTSVTATS